MFLMIILQMYRTEKYFRFINMFDVFFLYLNTLDANDCLLQKNILNLLRMYLFT